MSILNKIRYNNNHSAVLDNDLLFKKAPSIFAETASADRGEKYRFIPTIDVVEALRDEGFYPVAAFESRTRIEEKRGFTKHLIRFRKHDGFSTVGELHPELVLLNSHDGSSSYQLSAGLYRLACMNGLIVADSHIETVRCRHSGRTMDDVIEGTYSVMQSVPTALETVETFQALRAPVAVQNALAKAVIGLRWGDAETDHAPVTPDQLNRVRRLSDQGDDLWRVMNRVQENVIRGGLRGYNASGNRTTTRAVNSVTENVRLNKAIWQLTAEVAEILKNA